MVITDDRNNNNNIRPLCGNSLDQWYSMMYLPPVAIKGLAVLFILFGLVSSLLNVPILAFLVKTKKWKNQSKRLIMFLSVIFITNSTLGNAWLSTFVLMTYTNQTINCIVLFVFMLVKICFVLATSYIMVVIALDRFLHIVFRQNYATRFSRRRFNLVLFLYLIAVGLQASLFALGLKGKHGDSSLYTLPLNTLLFMMLITLYVLLLVRLRSEASLAQGNTRSLTKPSFIYLTVYLLIYFPALANTFIFNLTRKTNIGLSLSLFSVHLTVDLTGIASSVGFIVIDRRFREWIKTYFVRNSVAQIG